MTDRKSNYDGFPEFNEEDIEIITDKDYHNSHIGHIMKEQVSSYKKTYKDDQKLKLFFSPLRERKKRKK